MAEDEIDGSRDVASAMTAIEKHPPQASSPRTESSESARSGPVLALWIALTVALHGVLWLSGARPSALAEAVERGAGRAESRTIGEVGDDLIRKAIRTQQETLPFWTTLTLLGDFVAEPLALALRALVAATCLSALAALLGRPVRYNLALAECSTVQGFWVLGLAVRVGLAVALRRPEAETSATLFLAAGAYPAGLWLILRQADAFALIGWCALARGAWRRGQARPLVALAVCTMLALGEAVLRASLELTAGSAMRLDVMPE